MRLVQQVIVCEGYHDRAFLQGLLLDHGCTDPGDLGDGNRRPVRDPAGRTVGRGQFGFIGRRGAFIRVVPAHSQSRVWKAARDIVEDRELVAARLVCCFDADSSAGNTWSQRAAPRALAELAARFSTRIEAVHWHCADPPGAPGVPDKQTLERLICAALAAAYPERAEAVSAWIADQRVTAEPSHKAHAWSYMAGWNPDAGCESFYKQLWDDAAVRAELVQRLEAVGIWPILESLALAPAAESGEDDRGS